jgi:hypothetical protein
MLRYQNNQTGEVRTVTGSAPLQGALVILDNGDTLSEKLLKQDWKTVRRPEGEGTDLVPMWAFTRASECGMTNVGWKEPRIGLTFETESAGALAIGLREALDSYRGRTISSHSEIASGPPMCEMEETSVTPTGNPISTARALLDIFLSFCKVPFYRLRILQLKLVNKYIHFKIALLPLRAKLNDFFFPF